jgi:hypothetical protein
MDTNPYASPQEKGGVAPAVGNGRIFLAWIVFFLLSTVGSFIVGAVIGAMLGAALAAGNASLEQIKTICMAAGFLISLPISCLCFFVSVKMLVVPRRIS